MDGLKVAELKIILKSRGLSCKGNKESLVKRLRDALEVRTSASQSDHIAVQPDDSASQVRSNVSNRSSNCSSANSELKRAEEAADRAELVEKMRSLRDKQYFESKIAELRHGQELLELQSTINELAAREQAFQAYRNNGGISPAPASHPQAHTQYPIQQPPITEADFGHGSQPSLHLPLNERHLKGSRDDIHSELKAERERTAALMRLPPIEIKKFGGDITQFAQFIRSFEMKIASKLEDDSEKLHYLEQNLVSGSKPHTIVASCMYIEDGYEQAMQILRKRYGQPSTIAAAFMDKINDEERMEFGNGEDLDKFALLLMSCKNALGNACHLISDPRTLRNITEKLPSSLLNRWRRRVDDLEETHGRSAVFEDLVEFVMKEARVATNASFGQHMYDGSRGSGKKQINGSFSMVQNQESLVTATQAHSIDYSTCLFCGDKSHYLPECAKLKEMSAEEKKSFVMRNSLCFGCLRRGHRRNLCRRPARCRTCNRSHPTALHEHDGPGNLRGVQPQEQPRAQGETDGAKVTSCRTSTESQKCGAILPIVAVKAKSALGHCTTFAFLDSGSTHSFISTSLVHKLNLGHLPGCQLTLTTVDRAVSVPTQVVAGLSITDLEGENYLSLPALYTLPNLPVEAGQFPKAEDLEEWDHLQDIVLPQPEIAEVGLLLGADAFLAMEPLRVIPSVNGSPYATLTRFGWVICGLNQTASPPDVTTVCRTTVTESKSLEEMIKSFYNYEYAEHLHCTKRGLSAEDRLWMRKVESSIAYERGHYSVPLPLADDNVKLPNNFYMAKARLEKLKTKFERDHKFAATYKAYVNEMLDKGFAEIVPDDKLARNDGRVWFLPHHAVFHARKPDKFRVVFDCAAEFQGVSLNDGLLQGPDQTNTLLDVLLRFRMEPIAFMADIEGMFNQVTVPEADRDFIRFLWWKDGNTANKIEQRRMKVHIFGARSSPSVACYTLRRTAKDYESEFSKEAVETIQCNFYVDDVLKSCEDELTAVRLIQELKVLCSNGGFNLTKMTSNSSKVVKSIADEDKSKELKDMINVTDKQPDEKALGLVWKPEQDVLSIYLNLTDLKSRPRTRRGLLSAVGSLYDPLGMIAPTILRGKQILQDLAKKQLTWDREIPKEERCSWNAWLNDISETYKLSMPRCIKPIIFKDIVSYEIHHFADASERAYGTVSYCRIVNTAGDIHCSFLMGKAHLAPLKAVTIPRLELMAAVTAVRVSALIADAVKFDGLVSEELFWTDSTTVLRYIANNKTRFHTFVANRLAIIHDGSTKDQWNFVSSELNPADDVSRGVQSERWLKGPDFLWKSRKEWPSRPTALLPVGTNDPEVKNAIVSVTDVQLENAHGDTCAEPNLEDPIQKLIQYYSDRAKLIRAVAWIMKIKKTLKARTREAGKSSTKLTSLDLLFAEEEIIKSVQAKAFPTELNDLRQNVNVRPSSSISRLDPFLKEGMIRVGGRLQNADLAYNAKHPIIMPSHEKYTEMLVQDVHERLGHAGRQHVLAHVRDRMWILKGNATVRRVLNACLFCKRRFHSTQTQKCANLPNDRVAAFEKPFTNTGVDYFGPFFVRHGRGQAKRYGVIFTCLSVRAVHMEVADDLSADSFLCAMRRLVCRRGHVKVLRSDRATNFVGANNELKRELQNQEQNEEWIHYKTLKMGMDWVYNVPGASHHGGVWERQIRTIRRLLESMITSTSMKNETLVTFMCEVEAIINSRPLTPVSTDHLDTEPLSPNHLLLAGAGYDLVPVNLFNKTDSNSRKRWKQAAYYANMFWKRWRAEYLPLLQARPHHLSRAKPNLGVGDIVVVVDESVPRGQWPLGRVLRVKHSADGLVRSVELQVRGTTLQRPVTKIVKLI